MFSKFIGFSSDSSHTQIRLGDIVHMITHISCVLVSSKFWLVIVSKICFDTISEMYRAIFQIGADADGILDFRLISCIQILMEVIYFQKSLVKTNNC